MDCLSLCSLCALWLRFSRHYCNRCGVRPAHTKPTIRPVKNAIPKQRYAETMSIMSVAADDADGCRNSFLDERSRGQPLACGNKHGCQSLRACFAGYDVFRDHDSCS